MIIIWNFALSHPRTRLSLSEVREGMKKGRAKSAIGQQKDNLVAEVEQGSAWDAGYRAQSGIEYIEYCSQSRAMHMSGAA